MAVQISMSAKLYQERRLPDDRNTRRRPGPRTDLARNLVHRIPLSPPLPTAGVLQDEDNHPPDSALTQPWPHGGEEQF